MLHTSLPFLKGKIKTNDEEIYQFHSTSFQSSLPTRFPYLYEDVIVTFDNDRLISVRSDIEKQKSYYDLAFKPINVTNHPFPQAAHDKNWKPELQKSFTLEEYTNRHRYIIYGEDAELE